MKQLRIRQTTNEKRHTANLNKPDYSFVSHNNIVSVKEKTYDPMKSINLDIHVR